MNLTYKQLQKAISKMTDEQKNMNVSVYVDGFDEYFPVASITITKGDCDVLDEGSPVLNTPKE